MSNIGQQELPQELTRPVEVNRPRIGSLCSGYGGLDLAVEEVTGGKTVWVSDIDPGACKIIEHRFPDAPNLGDMTALDWGEVPPVDVLCGGTPCQDLSAAGRRAGMKEGTRSNLWVAMREAIAIIRPRLVVWENVRGALSASASSASDMEPGEGPVGNGQHGLVLRALGRVLGDLSSLGYDAEWATVPASAAGAPHRRDRVFLIAWPSSDSVKRRAGGHSVTTADVVENLLPTPRTSDTNGAGRHGSGGVDLRTVVAENLPPTPRAHDHQTSLTAPAARRHVEAATDFGTYAPAIERWERVLGRRAPAPTVENPRTGKPQLSPVFVEWMMGLPEWWVSDTELGLTRVQQLRALGNGVVPQQAAYALRGLLGRARKDKNDD